MNSDVMVPPGPEVEKHMRNIRIIAERLGFEEGVTIVSSERDLSWWINGEVVLQEVVVDQENAQINVAREGAVIRGEVDWQVRVVRGGRTDMYVITNFDNRAYGFVHAPDQVVELLGAELGGQGDKIWVGVNMGDGLHMYFSLSSDSPLEDRLYLVREKKVLGTGDHAKLGIGYEVQSYVQISVEDFLGAVKRPNWGGVDSPRLGKARVRAVLGIEEDDFLTNPPIAPAPALVAGELGWILHISYEKEDTGEEGELYLTSSSIFIPTGTVLELTNVVGLPLLPVPDSDASGQNGGSRILL